MVAVREWYSRVNAAWPEKVPPLTFEAGANAVRRLYRFVTGVTFSGEIQETSGNRYNYARRGVFYLNTQGHSGRGAWHDLIHDLSHTLSDRVYDYRIKPHSREHAKLELKLVKEVVRRGWLNGVKPKESKPAPDVKLVKLMRTEAAIQKWESKLKRAQNALKKLNRRRSYYHRAIGQSATIH